MSVPLNRFFFVIFNWKKGLYGQYKENNPITFHGVTHVNLAGAVNFGNLEFYQSSSAVTNYSDDITSLGSCFTL